MGEFVSTAARHGYLLLFAVVFGEAIGLPLPAALALIAAGAAAASHMLQGPVALIVAVIALLAGDSLLFLLGRSTGWALLGFLCKVSVNPESCILRSAESFYKRGRITLVFAKFIPGINTMAAPLAGSMKMRPLQFLQLDLAGASLYAFTYFAVGYLFRDFLVSITRGMQTAGHVFEIVLLTAVAGYVLYRVWLYRKYASYGAVPRVPVDQLAQRLAISSGHDVVIADVRSHGYYDGGSERIRGSIRIEPNNLAEELKNLPKDKEIYLYCT